MLAVRRQSLAWSKFLYCGRWWTAATDPLLSVALPRPDPIVVAGVPRAERNLEQPGADGLERATARSRCARKMCPTLIRGWLRGARSEAWNEGTYY